MYFHTAASGVNFDDILLVVFMSWRNLEIIGLFYGISQETQLIKAA